MRFFAEKVTKRRRHTGFVCRAFEEIFPQKSAQIWADMKKTEYKNCSCSAISLLFNITQRWKLLSTGGCYLWFERLGEGCALERFVIGFVCLFGTRCWCRIFVGIIWRRRRIGDGAWPYFFVSMGINGSCTDNACCGRHIARCDGAIGFAITHVAYEAPSIFFPNL